MPAVESTIVLLPRPTTLVGAATFCTMPLDVSGFGSVQLQVWRGPIRGGGTDPEPYWKVFFEESLDCETWALGSATPTGYDPAVDETGGDSTFNRPQLFAYAFRLRWFRLRVEVAGDAPIVTCFAEGLLRDGGGGGAWAGSPRPAAAAVSPPARAPGSGPDVGGSPAPGREATSRFTATPDVDLFNVPTARK